MRVFKWGRLTHRQKEKERERREKDKYRQSPVKNQPVKPQIDNFYVLTKVPHYAGVT